MDSAKIAKLARVALDHRTPAGEALTALQLIRDQHLDWCEVIKSVVEGGGLQKLRPSHQTTGRSCHSASSKAPCCLS
jgi:hypothetical protein